MEISVWRIEKPSLVGFDRVYDGFIRVIPEKDDQSLALCGRAYRLPVGRPEAGSRGETTPAPVPRGD
jgi:hypothetical protein